MSFQFAPGKILSDLPHFKKKEIMKLIEQLTE